MPIGIVIWVMEWYEAKHIKENDMCAIISFFLKVCAIISSTLNMK